MNRTVVIIPAKDCLATLPGCVDSVLGCLRTVASGGEPSGLAVKAPMLYVVDNGSADGTREWLLARRGVVGGDVEIDVLEEARPGPAAARNAGIRAALAQEPPPDFLAFLDADCIAPRGWLRAQVEFLQQHPDLDAVGGPLEALRFDNPVQEFIERQGIMDVAGFFRPPEGGPPPMVLTANLVMRRRALDRAGLFDESLPVGEDADWCWRLQWAGGRLGFNPAAAVEHRHRATWRAFARMMRRYGEGSVRVHRRHRPRLGPLRWDWTGAWRLAKALVKCAVLPLRRLTPYQRAEAPLEVVRYGAFLYGRWKAWLLG